MGNTKIDRRRNAGVQIARAESSTVLSTYVPICFLLSQPLSSDAAALGRAVTVVCGGIAEKAVDKAEISGE